MIEGNDIIVGIIFGLLITAAMFVVLCCVQLIINFDVTNAILVSGLVQLLTIGQQWNLIIRWSMFFWVLVVCLIFQNKKRLARVIFGAVSSFALGVMGYGWIVYDSKQEQWMVVVICMVVGMVLNWFCWVRKRV